MSGKINYAKQFAGCGITLMDRVQGNGGANITQSDITSIAYTVTRYGSKEEAEDEDSGTVTISSTALTKTTVVFNALQTASPWDSTADATGYNFRYDSPAADRPDTATGVTWDRYNVTFTPASGAAFRVCWVVETLP